MNSKNITRWIRSIILSPLWMFGIVGVPDGDSDSSEAPQADAGPSLNERIMAFAGNNSEFYTSSSTPDAAASEDEDQDADLDGNLGEETDEDAVSTSEEDGPDADQEEDGEADDPNSQETEEPVEGKKGIKQKTLEERAAEIAERIVTEKLAERERAVSQEKPDYVEIDQEKVNEYVRTIEEQIDELRLDGKYSEARKLSRQLDQLDADMEANEQRKQEFVKRQGSKQAATEQDVQIRASIDNAAEMYRDELKIKPEVWQQMGQWFESQITQKPILMTEFNDIFTRQGSVAAIRFAHEYATKNMGQKAKQSTEKKEQTKNQTARLTTTTTGKAPAIDMKKAHAAFAANPTPEAFAKYQELKRQTRAA